MRFLLALAGATGLVTGLAMMFTTGGAVTADKWTMIGAVLAVVGSVGLAGGIAAIDIVWVIREMRG
jgi:hypothetical protein